MNILLLELSENVLNYKFYTYSANTYVANVTNDYRYLPELWFPEHLIDNPQILVNITGVDVRSEDEEKSSRLVPRNSASEVVLSENSFYFDFANKLLYVHFLNNKPFDTFKENELYIYKSLGFSKTKRPFKDTEGKPYFINGVYYNPMVTGVSNFSYVKDDIFSGKQVFPEVSLEIENSVKKEAYDLKGLIITKDGSNRIIGNRARILSYSGVEKSVLEYTEFTPVFIGFIKQGKEGAVVSLKAQDLRFKFKDTVCNRFVDKTIWTEIEQDVPLKILYGKPFDVPTPCLNRDVNKGITKINQTAGAYSFALGDNTYCNFASNAIKKVYVDGVELNITAPSVSIDANGMAYFALAGANFRAIIDDETPKGVRFEGMEKVTVDVWGVRDTSNALITKGMQIIQDIILKTLRQVYSSVFYDTVTWEKYRGDDNFNYDSFLYVEKETPVWALIEDLSTGTLLGKFFINENFKYSWKVIDEVESVTEFTKEDIANNFYSDGVEETLENVLFDFKVAYKTKIATKEEEKYLYQTYMGNRENASVNYDVRRSVNFNSNINDSIVDAEKVIDRIKEFTNKPRRTVKLIVDYSKGSEKKAKQLRDGDCFDCCLDIPNHDLFGKAKLQVNKIMLNNNNFTVDIEAQIIKFY